MGPADHDLSDPAVGARNVPTTRSTGAAGFSVIIAAVGSVVVRAAAVVVGVVSVIVTAAAVITVVMRAATIVVGVVTVVMAAAAVVTVVVRAAAVIVVGAVIV